MLKALQDNDVYELCNNFIKNSVYPFRYRGLQQDTVALGMLEGYGKYVSESTGIKIKGENVLQFPIEEQKRYILRDSELSYQTNRTKPLRDP